MLSPARSSRRDQRRHGRRAVERLFHFEQRHDRYVRTLRERRERSIFLETDAHA